MKIEVLRLPLLIALPNKNIVAHIRNEGDNGFYNGIFISLNRPVLKIDSYGAKNFQKYFSGCSLSRKRPPSQFQSIGIHVLKKLLNILFLNWTF